METQSSQPGATLRTHRARSSAYPSYPIETCVAFTDKVDREFGNVLYTPKEDISKALGSSGGSFLMTLSSCVQYELLELKHGEGYKSTVKFRKIKKPLPDENVNDFKKECLQSPELYKKLISEFQGRQLPSEIGLSNILDRKYGVVGGAAKIAAKVFLKNLADLSVITEDNILHLELTAPVEGDSAEQQDGNTPKGTVVSPLPDLPLPAVIHPPIPLISAPKTKDIPVYLDDKDDMKERKVLIGMPADFDDKDLKRIIRVLKSYMRDENASGG